MDTLLSKSPHYWYGSDSFVWEQDALLYNLVVPGKGGGRRREGQGGGLGMIIAVCQVLLHYL